MPEGRPGLYIGKTKSNELATAQVEISLADLQSSPWIARA